MSIVVVSSRHFEKAVAKLPAKVKEVLRLKLEIFMTDPYADVLKNHQLHGSFRHYRSISVTGDYRLIYEEYDENILRLIDIGTHGRIYGK